MRPPQPPQRPMVRPTARPVLRLALMELLLISGEARRFGRADPVEGNCHADHPLSPDEPSPCRCFPSESSLSKRLDEEGRSWSLNLGAMKDERLSPLWHTIAMTGMRRGEAIGLRWSDVDLEG